MSLMHLVEEALVAIRDANRASEEAHRITTKVMEAKLERERELQRIDIENNGRNREAFAFTLEQLKLALADAKARVGR